jgi:hypothetical protein
MNELDPLILASIKRKVPEYYAKKAKRLLNRQCFYRKNIEEQLICTRGCNINLINYNFTFSSRKYFGEVCTDKKFDTCEDYEKPPFDKHN